MKLSSNLVDRKRLPRTIHDTKPFRVATHFLHFDTESPPAFSSMTSRKSFRNPRRHLKRYCSRSGRRGSRAPDSVPIDPIVTRARRLASPQHSLRPLRYRWQPWKQPAGPFIFYTFLHSSASFRDEGDAADMNHPVCHSSRDENRPRALSPPHVSRSAIK